MRAFVSLLALFGILAAGPALAGSLVVIESNAPGIAPGQVLDGAQSLDVPEGTEVTCIGQDGDTVKLTGPYSGVPAPGGGAANASFLDSLAALVAPEGEGSVALGATREVPGAAGVPGSPWLIDVSKSGDRCTPPAAPPVLWRPDAGEAIELYLKRFGDDAEAEVDWAGEAAEIEWPDGIAVVDGGVYLVRLGRKASMKKLVLHLVPADLATDAHRAVWMAGQRCTRQARQLLFGVVQ